MSRFNLLEENWIPIIRENGKQENVSIRELFLHADEYSCLAGDMQAQNFAILRILLAILQTVFSRYDNAGNAIVSVDDHMRQIDEVEDDEEEQDIYIETLQNTWISIWNDKAFPKILYRYLDTWYDRFYLLDDKYPFFQVTKKAIDALLPQNKSASDVCGRFINRNISESGNKTALFAPVSGTGKSKDKDILTEAQLARWLITFQGYTGLSDKTSLYDKNSGLKPSKGWLFDLGGLYLSGDNLFETLTLNLELVHPDTKTIHMQHPCWEYSGEEFAGRLIENLPVDNLAELYTNWSRAIYIDPDIQMPGPVTLSIGKLPAICHEDAFVETMTIWKLNQSGDNKGHYTPRKHNLEQSMWRSFGMIAMPSSEKNHKPGIMTHLDTVSHSVGNRKISLNAISMQDDGNATSWLPVDEISDNLKLNDLVLTDGADEGWLIRINDAVNDSKDVIDNIYRSFISDIADVRRISKENTYRNSFVSNQVGEVYQKIDMPFRTWLENIQPDDSKEARISEWKQILKKIVEQQAEVFVSHCESGDYRGIVTNEGKIKNIVTAYQTFRRRMNRKFM